MLHDNLSVNNNGHLCFAGFDTVELAKKYGTPLMLLDENKIRNTCREYKKAMSTYFGGASCPAYASKALSFKHLYKILREEEMDVDVASIGELYTAIKGGFDSQRIFFHSNNKSDSDIEFAIDNNIGHFVADSKDEVEAINRIAEKKNVVQKILLRLSPGIDPHTHAKISTGKVDSKFGTAIETGQAALLVKYTLGLKNIELCGFHCHIGSQIFDIDPFCDAADIMVKFIAQIKETYGFCAPLLSLGGGFGVRYVQSQPIISYTENIKKISEHIKNSCKTFNISMPQISMEPGRSIVAASGITIYTVGSIKEIPGYKNYVSVDGGLPDNPRYALYEAEYSAIIANKADKVADYKCTIAGRTCESGDLIQENIMLQKAVRSDNLAVFVTGAYNYSMASNYNRVPRPIVVMLDSADKSERIVIKRETLEQLIANDGD